MNHSSLAEIIGKNLRKALWVLLGATLAVNAVLVIYDVRTLTSSIYNSFSSQLQNVARVSSQRGDMLSLQKDLEAVASPLAEAFSVDVEITDLSTQKMIVDIPGERGFIGELFTKKVTSRLEVNPVGSLEARITFDISNIVLAALLKALLSSVLILAAIFAVRRHVDQLNRENLDPIDKFSKWLDTLGPEGLVSKDLKFPTDGIQEDLKAGLESLARKMSELTSEVATLETERQVGQIARRVAHDIRSPLTALRMLASTVSTLTVEEKQIIDLVTARINRIADNLLEQTKLKQSKKPLMINKTDLKVHKALSEIIQEKALELKDRPGLIIDARIPADFIDVSVDFNEDEFKRIVSNLINNAVEGTEGAGSIYLEASKNENIIEVSVMDTGRGIPEEVLSKLMQEPVTTKPNGNGIGIFASSESLRAKGHALRLSSRVDIGTRATIEFSV